MTQVYLSLGSNQGTRRQNLDAAVRALKQRCGRVLQCSSYIETAPWGYHSTNNYLNAALCLQTTLNPRQLLRATQQIERDLGRTEKTTHQNYTDRPIDIDILLYENQIVCEPDLQIPHPLLHQRLFVLVPLAEIAPNLMHPVLHHTIKELLETLRSQNP